MATCVVLHLDCEQSRFVQQAQSIVRIVREGAGTQDDSVIVEYDDQVALSEG